MVFASFPIQTFLSNLFPPKNIVGYDLSISPPKLAWILEKLP